ncbi:MAG: ABC-2 transporter permease, partial [Lachnospiraceae bacterium]|nr:ABC-2 transporter permease [Lachnospiraceae bacterium]
MKKLLNKELKLAIIPLTWFFLAASLMTLIPGYPILLGSFFVCLGLFQTFITFRESNDILYTALLPVKKRDAVKAKYLMVLFFECLSFLLMCILTALRMTVLAGAKPYVTNFLMNPNPIYLGFVLLVFLTFNLIFVGGFFRTAYKVGGPFIAFIIVAMLIVAVSESLHHIPGLVFLHTPSGEKLGLQWIVFGIALTVFALGTFLSERKSKKRFES